MQLVGRMTKLGWLDANEHQQIVSEVSKFLHATPRHLVLGLQLLSTLVNRPGGKSGPCRFAVAGNSRPCHFLWHVARGTWPRGSHVWCKCVGPLRARRLSVGGRLPTRQ